MKVVDLYHIESRPMFMDLDTKKIIRDEEAAEISKKVSFRRDGPFLRYEEGIPIPEFGGRIAYGSIYTI